MKNEDILRSRYQADPDQSFTSSWHPEHDILGHGDVRQRKIARETEQEVPINKIHRYRSAFRVIVENEDILRACFKAASEHILISPWRLAQDKLGHDELL